MILCYVPARSRATSLQRASTVGLIDRRNSFGPVEVSVAAASQGHRRGSTPQCFSQGTGGDQSNMIKNVGVRGPVFQSATEPLSIHRLCIQRLRLMLMEGWPYKTHLEHIFKLPPVNTLECLSKASAPCRCSCPACGALPGLAAHGTREGERKDNSPRNLNHKGHYSGFSGYRILKWREV